jgi:hypothetical protein
MQQHRAHRFPAQFPVQIRTPYGSQSGLIVDVNHAGAQVKGVKRLNRGDKLQINVLSHWVHAIVCWSIRGHIGVVFRPHVSDHKVDTMRHRCNRRKHMGRGSVGFGFSEMR